MPAPQPPRDRSPRGPEPAIYPRGFTADSGDVLDVDAREDASATVAQLRGARQELAELMARLSGGEA